MADLPFQFASSAGPIAGSSRSAAAPRPKPSWWWPSSPTDRNRGRGECVPYGRYGAENRRGASRRRSRRLAAEVAGGLDRMRLQSAMAAGAARNGARLRVSGNLEAKARVAAQPMHLAGASRAPRRSPPLSSTISLAAPEAMAQAGRGPRVIAPPAQGQAWQARMIRPAIAAVRARRAPRRVDRSMPTRAGRPTRLAAKARRLRAPRRRDLGGAAAPRRSRTMRSRQMARPLPICGRRERCMPTASLAALVGKYDGRQHQGSTRPGGVDRGAPPWQRRRRRLGFKRMAGLHGGRTLARDGRRRCWVAQACKPWSISTEPLLLAPPTGRTASATTAAWCTRQTPAPVGMKRRYRPVQARSGVEFL